MGWNVLVDLLLEHAYYAPAMPPVTVRPADSLIFGRDGLLLRQSGGRIYVLAEDGNYDLPGEVVLDLDAQNHDVISVTRGGDWQNVPQILMRAGSDRVELEPESGTDLPQVPGRPKLARITVQLNHSALRKVTAAFTAVSSHWAYHLIGPSVEDVVIEDTEGEVLFEPMGFVHLPDGTPARVIRSRAPLPARARPGQRFSLTRPGPFGPRMLIPVLPAPQPRFAKVPGPDGTGAIIQSDIFVSIF